LAVLKLLETTLGEQKKNDASLTKLAQSEVNQHAQEHNEDLGSMEVTPTAPKLKDHARPQIHQTQLPTIRPEPAPELSSALSRLLFVPP
jgi:hypothetical protein